MYNRGKFHLYSISGCEVKKFEMFSLQWRIHEMTHFRVFLIHNCPKYGRILLKFLPEIVLKEAKSVFEESLKNRNFY